MTLATLPRWAREIVETERVARLAFSDGDDLPRVLPVTFAVADAAIWTAIDRKPKRTPEPARIRWLARRPEAALCVDVYEDDWTRLAWVQLLGRVAVLDREGGRPGLAALAAKYPQYRELEPPGPVLMLEIRRALCWRAGDQPTYTA